MLQPGRLESYVHCHATPETKQSASARKSLAVQISQNPSQEHMNSQVDSNPHGLVKSWEGSDQRDNFVQDSEIFFHQLAYLPVLEHVVSPSVGIDGLYRPPTRRSRVHLFRHFGTSRLLLTCCFQNQNPLLWWTFCLFVCLFVFFWGGRGHELQQLSLVWSWEAIQTFSKPKTSCLWCNFR